MKRTIFFAASCDEAANRLGGYERIDSALEAVYIGLAINPYDFPVIESDHFYRTRYLVTLPTGSLPGLVWLFTIGEDNNVTLTHVEEHDGY